MVFTSIHKTNFLFYIFTCIVEQQESMKNKYSSSLSCFNLCLFLALILIGSISGGLESNIICKFSKPNQTAYWTGEFVSGTIEFTNPDRQELKLKSIDLELIGNLGYKYMSGSTRGSVSKRTGTNTFLNERLDLNSTKLRGGFRLSSGNHKWPFRFFLNDSLPPSIKQRKPFDSFIYYYLKIVFVRSEWYKRNIKTTIPIVVNHRSPSVASTKVEAQETNRKDVRLHVILQKSFVAVGTNISFDVEIDNPKEVLIERISVALVQELALGPNQEKSRNIVDETLKTIKQFKDTHIQEKFQFHIPHMIPPTFVFHFPAKNRERPLSINYELLFEAHLAGFYTNIRLKLPLIVTDHPQNIL